MVFTWVSLFTLCAYGVIILLGITVNECIPFCIEILERDYIYNIIKIVFVIGLAVALEICPSGERTEFRPNDAMVEATIAHIMSELVS